MGRGLGEGVMRDDEPKGGTPLVVEGGGTWARIEENCCGVRIRRSWRYSSSC